MQFTAESADFYGRDCRFRGGDERRDFCWTGYQARIITALQILTLSLPYDQLRRYVNLQLKRIAMDISQCFVDESIYTDLGVVVTAIVFAESGFENDVAKALKDAGINSPKEEFKSSAKMDSDPRMRVARKKILQIADSSSKIAVFFGPFARPRLGRQTLQALQSVLIRNSIDPNKLIAYFDREIFSSQNEADRLQSVFRFLKPCEMFAVEDSKVRVGIQVADCVAHSFGQIIKEGLTGKKKNVDVGGGNTGYMEGTEAPLGWSLLMSLRNALLTRPVIYGGEQYTPECDPVVLDPENDDVVDFVRHPILLGWGIQVAPEAMHDLRQAIENDLGRIWLGCIH